MSPNLPMLMPVNHLHVGRYQCVGLYLGLYLYLRSTDSIKYVQGKQRIACSPPRSHLLIEEYEYNFTNCGLILLINMSWMQRYGNTHFESIGVTQRLLCCGEKHVTMHLCYGWRARTESMQPGYSQISFEKGK